MVGRSELERFSSVELYRLAGEAVSVAAGRSGGRALDSHAYWTVGALRRLLAALDGALAGVAVAMTGQARSGALVAIEGPFTGDAAAATMTAEVWLAKARAPIAEEALPAVDNAHVATAGLAAPSAQA